MFAKIITSKYPPVQWQHSLSLGECLGWGCHHHDQDTAFECVVACYIQQLQQQYDIPLHQLVCRTSYFDSHSLCNWSKYKPSYILFQNSSGTLSNKLCKEFVRKLEKSTSVVSALAQKYHSTQAERDYSHQDYSWIFSWFTLHLNPKLVLI